jgi:probable addiction module antidote protein
MRGHSAEDLTLGAGGDKSTQARDIKPARGMVCALGERGEWKMPKTGKRKNRLGVSPFEPVDYLDNAEVLAEYLAAALEDPNPDVFLHALANVAKARGMSKVAKAAGLGRESLYKGLTPGAKIRYDTVRKLLNSLGVRLTVRTP